jgi:hypothetical protein
MTSTLALADTKYTYDALGRLQSVQVQGGVLNGQQQSFSYDAAGNRLQVQRQLPPNAQPTVITPTSTVLGVMGGATVLTLTVGGASAGGTASVSIDGAYFGTATVANGSVSIHMSGVSLGQHQVSVIYTGDANNEPATYAFAATARDLSWLPAVIDFVLSN